MWRMHCLEGEIAKERLALALALIDIANEFIGVGKRRVEIVGQ